MMFNCLTDLSIEFLSIYPGTSSQPPLGERRRRCEATTPGPRHLARPVAAVFVGTERLGPATFPPGWFAFAYLHLSRQADLFHLFSDLLSSAA
jgi:hypothetical protein